ncbi:MAG: DUF4350 domain-containing protein [Candidatus Riflebacteria bacterium]|nr:DUF4350 domain-containing protein [Candidatus Riflebacteria bacterium]
MKYHKTNKLGLKLFFLFLVFQSFNFLYAASPIVFFDNGHAQTAGNADWTINGAYSEFADVFKNQGCDVRSLSQMNSKDLSQATILVLPEPNSAYSTDEQNAIVDFANKGGCLFLIADHDGSDRNGDGIDSVGVFNQFASKLGIQFNKKYFSEAPVTGPVIKSVITDGVTAVGNWGSTSVAGLAPSAIAHIRVSAKNGGGAYIITNELPGGGKVVAMGDSSPFDDGTGAPGKQLHNGFTNPAYSHKKLAENCVKWFLTKRPSFTPQACYDSIKSDYLNVSSTNLTDYTNPIDKSDVLNQLQTNLLSLIDKNHQLATKLSADAANNESLSDLNKKAQEVVSFSVLHKETK